MSPEHQRALRSMLGEKQATPGCLGKGFLSQRAGRSGTFALWFVVKIHHKNSSLSLFVLLSKVRHGRRRKQ